MKKKLFAVLATVFLGILGFSSMNAEAAEEKIGVIEVEEREPLIGFESVQGIPEEELNPELISVNPQAFLFEGKTYLIVELERDIDLSIPFVNFFDEDGNKVDGFATTYQYSDDGYVVRMRVPAFEGSKEFTCVFYAFESTGYEYTASKTFTIEKCVEWQGSVEERTVKLCQGNNNVYMDFYLPFDPDFAKLEIALYDDEKKVGMVDFGFSYRDESKMVYINSLLEGISRSVYLHGAEYHFCVSADLDIGQEIESGTYTLKATYDGKIYEMGCLNVEAEPYLFSVHVNGGCSSDKPVITLWPRGYDCDDLTVELRDKTTGEVLATSEGGAKFQEDMDHADFVLNTDMALSELEESLITVLKDDEIIYQRTAYYIRDGIAAAYYNHADDVVVTYTNGVEEGAEVTATIEGGYEATGIVSDRKVVLAFTRDGEAAKLPVGTHRIDYTYQSGGRTLTDYVPKVKVMGSVADGEGTAEICEVKREYFCARAKEKVEFIVSENLLAEPEADCSACFVNEDGDTVAEVILEAESVIEEATKCLKLTGEVEGLAEGVYYLYLYCGEEEIECFYVMAGEKDKNYGYYYWFSQVSGGPTIGVFLSAHNGALNEDLFELKVSDINGNTEGIEIEKSDYYYREGIGSYMEYYVKKVPEGVWRLKMDVTYDGQPIYDMSDFQNSTLPTSFVQVWEELDSYKLEFEKNGLDLVYGVAVSRPCTAQIVEAGTTNVVKTLQLPAGETKFTKEMLEGVNVDDASVMYDIYFDAEGGNFYHFQDNVYLAVRLDEVMENGIGKDEQGRDCLYIDGEIALDYTGPYYWSEKEKWVMIVSGLVSADYTGLVQDGDIWWYVVNGVLASDYTGLVKQGDELWYVSLGKVDFTYQGLLCYLDEWYYIVDGVVDAQYNGLAFVNDAWWYVVAGKIDFTFTGLADVNNASWYVVQGKIDFDYTGLVCIDDEWYFIEQGRWNTECSGMLFVNNAWWYVVNGKIDFDFTGLTFVAERWWYVNAGRIDFSYCGLCEYGGKLWYIINGEIDYKTYGLVWWNDRWFFVDNGAVRTDYTGMLFVNSAWWYVKEGEIDFSFCGLFLFDESWWYVENGMIQFGYTGLVFFNDTWWYVENGRLNGDYYGLAYVNDNWWYVQGGKIDFDFSGLVFFNGDWWYVSGARVDFTYNGTAVGPDGNLYKIVDGKVVSLA